MKPLKIVYLDDEPELLSVFTNIFGKSDVEIQTFIVPSEAILEIKKNPPGLIILNYWLSNTTGDKVAQLINPDIPRILVTGELDINLESRFLKVFQKPVPILELKDFIESVKLHRIS